MSQPGSARAGLGWTAVSDPVSIEASSIPAAVSATATACPYTTGASRNLPASRTCYAILDWATLSTWAGLSDAADGRAHIGPWRLVRGELLPEIGHEFGKLVVRQAVLEGRHVAKLARSWRCDAMQDHLNEIVRHRAMQIAVQRERWPAAEQRRAADLMANRAGPFIEPGAKAGRGGDPCPGQRFEFGRQRVPRRLVEDLLLERAEVDRHGANILVGQRRKFFHHRRHRPCRDAVKAGFAGAQIGVQLVLAPGNRRVRQRGQRRCFPALRETAGQIRLGLFRAEHVSWRMAGATMAKTLDQIGAAIPCGRLRRIGFQQAGTMEQRVPSR